MVLDRPASDIVEISLFGTGGGYGESVIIHFPENNWIIVDSCIDPKTQINIPLNYLNSIGVDLKNVKRVIATHWHDDHILGLSDILKKCHAAELVLARSTDPNKFLKLVGLDNNKSKESRSTSEYYKCIQIIKERGFKLREAISDRLLFSEKLNDVPIELFTLSPSDYSNTLFDIEISSLMNNYGAADKKIIHVSPNHRSVVLLIKAGMNRAILGADLEVASDARVGWKHIMSDSLVLDQPSTLFKIPHHGSENGYCDEIWTNLITRNPTACLTPWNHNKKLPNSDMLALYSRLCDSLYITSPNIDLRKKKKDKSIERLIAHFGAKVNEIRFSFGQVRYRANLHEDNNWSVDVDGEAFHVNQAL